MSHAVQKSDHASDTGSSTTPANVSITFQVAEYLIRISNAIPFDRSRQLAFQTAITVKEAIDNIRHKRYVLPAIQRELVWDSEQIETLFDSLMRGYPINSFLFWHVEGKHVNKYKFYDFVLKYHERDRPHNDPLPPLDRTRDVTAILDGQQRLTALYIGMHGSYATKLSRYRWSSDWAFPPQSLYLDLLSPIPEPGDDDGYAFKFLTEDEAASESQERHWYKVGDIAEVDDATDLIDLIHDLGLAAHRDAHKLLAKLHNVVNTKGTISFYLERSQDLHEVLNIFIRINSGGTQLSYADMLLSTATAQWDTRDARKEFNDLTDQLNATGELFRFGRNFVLKAALMLADIEDVRFNVSNVNYDNMRKVEQNWGDIARSVRIAVELAAHFGLSHENLRANNSLIPIAYYIYSRKLQTEFLQSSSYADDRRAMRAWLFRSLLKRGVWGSGLDGLLMALRSTIKSADGLGFPRVAIEGTMRRLGKGLSFDDDELDDVIDNRYGSPQSFLLLSLLYPFVNVKSNRFHVDHVFPQAQMTVTKLRAAEIPEDGIAKIRDGLNRLPNLQLLEGIRNQEKSSMMPHRWLATSFADHSGKANHVANHDLGEVPDSNRCFLAWYDTRHEQMLQRLRNMLGVTARAEEADTESP